MEATELQKRTRARHLAVREIPVLRIVGSVLLSAGVFVNNRYLLHENSLVPWIEITVIMAVYCALSWAMLTLFYDRVPFDLSLVFLLVDLPVWTLAIYYAGAERSWLDYILFMRVADQTQTTFRRCIGFVVAATLCYASMLAWIIVVDGRAISESYMVAKLLFISLGGFYIALSARTSERRRAAVARSIRVSRDLIGRLESQSLDLREAREQADDASAAKSEFLANMSHEMRTPLHGILGMLQLSIDSETSPDRVRQLQMARRSAEALLSTIGDILDFSKIEARKLDLEPVYFSLRDIVGETLKSLAFTAAEKDLPLSFSIRPEVPERVWGDPLRLRQVLVNLIGNAIKFTRSGEIVVSVFLRTPSENDSPMVFEVRDTGIGIDPSKREEIFRPFSQADPSHSRRYGGTGLGLAIVSRLAEAMGGTIEMESELGTGSVFRLVAVLPSDPMGAPPAMAWERMLSGMRILVIEPFATSRAIIRDILTARGVEVHAFATLEEARPMPLRRFACLVADAPIIGSMIPVVRIVSPLDREHEAGVTLTRPVAERELIEAIGEAVGIAERGATFTLQRQPPSESVRSVLVVDDHPVNLEFALEALRRMGHLATPASSGEEALDLLSRRRFDLVLMDVQMPGIDGLEATRRFRGSEAGGHMMIVALTAHTTREIRDACLEAGCDAVLAKPLSRSALAEVLRGSAEPPPQRYDSILESVHGNLQLLARVRAAFAVQTPRLLQAMREAVDRQDGVALYQSAHTLKGSISNFPVPDAVHAAGEVELAGKSASFERASELIPLLEARLRDLERQIDAALG
ncbi:MAG: ATP-binding protein [Thermoanaerobaculia bacterium]